MCVDIGNSGMRCVLVPDSLHDLNGSSASASISTAAATAAKSVPWYGDLLRVDWCAEPNDQGTPALIERAVSQWLKPHSIKTRWLVSSVQRTMESYLKNATERLGAEDYHLVTYHDLQLDVRVDYPDKVGIDRLLAALAALQKFPDQPLIVIQAGSAITVDWIEPPNLFCGGAITPGVPMMLRLLSKAADLLPEVAAKELLNLPPLPGKNTTAAMNLGVSSAVVGGVQHLISRYREQFGKETLVVISGGDGPLLSPHLQLPWQIVDHLVLRGLVSMVR